MRIYDPLNGLALLSEEPQFRRTVVYAFFIRPPNVSPPAIAGPEQLKANERRPQHTPFFFFFFLKMQMKEEKLWLGHQGDETKRETGNKEANILNNKLLKCIKACFDGF